MDSGGDGEKMVIEYLGNDEYRAFLVSLKPSERVCTEIEEGHPAHGLPNLIHPVTGIVMVLKPQ